MKLNKSKMLIISFMLFSLFFGAGNLIFPPFLGQNAGNHTVPAMIGFLITAVILPILGVVVVAKFDGLNRLAEKVGKRFSMIFTLLIYLSIGPGLGIPRAASVPFEMAVAPYLPEKTNLTIWMFAYSLVFFLVALWLCLNPGKLVSRIGTFLTPSLLILLCFLFITFLFNGQTQVAPPQTAYVYSPFLQGFSDGYQTMDTIAALNFGLVIATTLGSFGLNDKKSIIRHTVLAGIFAGSILSAVYVMLTYMGMCSSGVYSIHENGAWTLRAIVYQLFGNFGAILLAAIFTLACLTTCLGLINSISQYFSTRFKKLTYRQWVYVIVVFSFLICNLGLNAILSISVPILNAIYPISIVLIILGLSHKLWENNRCIYPLTIASTGFVSILYSLETAGFPLGFFGGFLHKLPLYSEGFCWFWFAIAAIFISVILNAIFNKKKR
ncbi:MAG: branched-chain amino acid transport system II carrier protein [Oscillospiraceae bacterium]|nr:branched-chain amino acid transport system II carrier protein [Oscillospiraceae bacterium]